MIVADVSELKLSATGRIDGWIIQLGCRDCAVTSPLLWSYLAGVSLALLSSDCWRSSGRSFRPLCCAARFCAAFY